jgi:hypothetical protein
LTWCLNPFSFPPFVLFSLSFLYHLSVFRVPLLTMQNAKQVSAFIWPAVSICTRDVPPHWFVLFHLLSACHFVSEPFPLYLSFICPFLSTAKCKTGVCSQLTLSVCATFPCSFCPYVSPIEYKWPGELMDVSVEEHRLLTGVTPALFSDVLPVLHQKVDNVCFMFNPPLDGFSPTTLWSGKR